MLRSILSVLAGIMLWGALWVGANSGAAALFPDRFDASGATDSVGLLFGFLVISSALSVLAGFTCAAIANRSHMKHVGVLAAIQLGIGIMVQIGVWSLMPVWYHLVFLGLVVPMHLLGGRARVGGEAARA